MTDAAYRRAAQIATARPWRGHSVQTNAMLGRVRALRQLSKTLGVVTLPPVGRRAMPKPGQLTAGAGYRVGILPGHGALATARRPILAARAQSKLRSAKVTVARVAVATLIKQAGSKTHAGVGSVTFARLGLSRYLPAVVPLYGAAGAGARPGPVASPSARLGAASRAFGKTAQRADANTGLPTAHWARHQFAASIPLPAAAPGFHRTVRQPQAGSAAGHVYLDKALVGYHLAAVVTAEQTRVAARPNGSAASFNTSMAVLRPSGAGL